MQEIPGRQGKPRREAAEFRVLQLQLAAIEFRQIANDGEAKSGAGRIFIQAPATCARFLQLLIRKTGPVILHEQDRLLSQLHRGHFHLALRPFAGVLHQVAQHLGQVLTLAGDHEPRRGRGFNLKAAIREQAPQSLRDLFGDRGDIGFRRGRPGQRGGARPGKVMLHQIVGRTEFAARQGKVRPGPVFQRVSQHRKPRTQCMCKVADMTASPFDGGAVLLHQPVDLGDQRLDLGGARQMQIGCPSGPQVGHRAAQPPQGTQSEIHGRHGEPNEAGAEQRETDRQAAAQTADLGIGGVARHRDLHVQRRAGIGQNDRALDQPQVLTAWPRNVGYPCATVSRSTGRQALVPQRARCRKVIWSGFDLPIGARKRLVETRLRDRAYQNGVAGAIHVRCRQHGIEQAAQPRVE